MIPLTHFPHGTVQVLSQVNNTNGGTDTVVQNSSPIIEPGQTVTLLLDLDSDYRMGRDTQFKMETTNGAVFVGTVNIGQQSG